MNIIIFSTDDNLGAGKAAYRVYKDLLKSGNTCRLIVKNKTIIDDNIISLEKNYLEKLYTFFTKSLRRIKYYNLKTDSEYYFFGWQFEFYNVDKMLERIGFMPDIVIICWVSRFISPNFIQKLYIKSKAKIIAYPMDMSIFTGGCHYSWDCDGYKFDCSNCPAIISLRHKDLAYKILKLKKLKFDKLKLKIIPATSQLLNQVSESNLFKTQTYFKSVLIPIDGQIFNNKYRDSAKKIFDFCENDFTILFGAAVTLEKRKGAKLFIESLITLRETLTFQQANAIQIIIVGNKSDSILINNIPFKIKLIEYIHDDLLLSLLYQASNVFVSTSIQDSGPMMINESLMCGTPVISFDVGVARDLIINGQNGYIIDTGNIKGISNALKLFISKKSIVDHNSISHTASQLTGFGILSKSFGNII